MLTLSKQKAKVALCIKREFRAAITIMMMSARLLDD